MKAYPSDARTRDRWIVARRPPRNQVDPFKPYAQILECERAENGEVVDVATVFLTGRECPWRCVMCDLWKNTTEARTPVGAVPAQIDFALNELALGNPDRRPRQIKLYNSGSFFDRLAVPIDDHRSIAGRVAVFERVIVECHPSLIGNSTYRFRDLLRTANGKAKLEVAMGLETAHPGVLEKLNKRFTVDEFAKSAEKLRREEISLRVFVLIRPPFMEEAESVEWANRSIEFAFDCGATVVSLIPTRAGNGALEVLSQFGSFALPRLASLEVALDHGVGLDRGRVFADLWDLEKFSTCPECFSARRARLEKTNLDQRVIAPVRCQQCQ